MKIHEVIDGGLATTLVKHGHNGINNDPLWSASLLKTDPQSIYKAHKEFSDKGATILISASYQASISGFRDHLSLTSDQGDRYREYIICNAMINIIYNYTYYTQ